MDKYRGRLLTRPDLVSTQKDSSKWTVLPPGKYQLYETSTINNRRVEPVMFDINVGNVNGLVVKAFNAVNLSGQVVFEGSDTQWRPEPGDLVVAVDGQHATI